VKHQSVTVSIAPVVRSSIPHIPRAGRRSETRSQSGAPRPTLAARNVASIVKAAAAKLGLEASAFAGHSLRAGFVTSAVKRGANLIKITDVTGHRSLEMLKTYSRDAEAFVGHAGAGLL
jgi:hypothetical protein